MLDIIKTGCLLRLKKMEILEKLYGVYYCSSIMIPCLVRNIPCWLNINHARYNYNRVSTPAGKDGNAGEAGNEPYSEFDWKCWKTTGFLLFWQEKLKFSFGPNDN